MSKLFKIKQWVTAQQALDFLSMQLGEKVEAIDLLQLALDRKLKISVKFDYRVPAKLGMVVPFKDVPRRELPSLKAGMPTQTFLDGYCLVKDTEYSEETPFVCFDKGGVSYIDGVWDLAMLGNEAIQVANALQEEIGAEDLDLINLEGTFLCRTDGVYANLQERFKAPQEGFYPASGLPDSSTLIFRTAELNRFVSELNNPQEIERPLETRERNTLLLIIAALCRDAGHDASKPSKAAMAIQATLDQMGVKVGETTIRGHLKEIPNALESRMN